MRNRKENDGNPRSRRVGSLCRVTCACGGDWEGSWRVVSTFNDTGQIVWTPCRPSGAAKCETLKRMRDFRRPSGLCDDPLTTVARGWGRGLTAFKEVNSGRSDEGGFVGFRVSSVCADIKLFDEKEIVYVYIEMEKFSKAEWALWIVRPLTPLGERMFFKYKRRLRATSRNLFEGLRPRRTRFHFFFFLIRSLHLEVWRRKKKYFTSIEK